MGHAFQTGQIGAREFADYVVNSWPISLTADEFIEEFATWSRALYPGASELLASLRSRYRLAALSNTNETHWRRNLDVLGVNALFERCFASHEIGVAKPDAAAYRCVLDALGVDAADVVFFDDNAANVEAARQLGIDAHQVVGVDSLRRCLGELGLLEA
jgi:glucose-1-phosphatase